MSINVIAGPCSAESRDQVLKTAGELRSLGITQFRAGVWKPRTKPGGFEGIGEPALEWIDEAKTMFGIRTAVEVANKEQVELAIKHHVDILWIGARTTADPFAVQEIADVISKSEFKEYLTIYIKNPVCPDLDLWEGAYLRIKNTGVQRIGVIHRGFKVYGESKYRNEPIWRIPLDFKTKYPDVEILCDPSHIAGDRKYIEEISNIAINTYGFDGLIVESHENPDSAWTDAKQQLKPKDMMDMIDKIINERKPQVVDTHVLDEYRKKIDYYDAHIIYSLEERLKLSKLIGKFKKEHGMTTFQKNRWNSLLNNIIEMGKAHGLDESYITDIWEIIHEKSIEIQQ